MPDRSTLPPVLPDAYAGYERRVSVRYTLPGQVSRTVIAPASEGHFTARVRNLSTSGAGLFGPRPFEPGQVLSIETHSPDWGRLHTLPMRVVHVTPWADGEWLLGCEFLRPLTEYELQSLVLRAVPAAVPR